ncbi:DUF6221 family protein [Amycolatopsis roodepoortensis]|uniref:Uncharacterized protein n=1 Tax=Amycolatopsis roodepoortensis TaxID=700274 RepID=A0ABR9L4G5_9PSEU|nr:MULTISPECIES: DUF6221 family protein [Amycolatopsis]MBE1575051.1 hypothetical protein [Amycolatopsis roodepoortensis]GHG97281.1 hypothetical protein GCM10017788_76680 [Amycolatopsis acidiphila]
MDDLIAFLRAQLDKDEQAARAASPGPWQVDKETYPEAIHGADGATPVSGGRWGGEASVFDKDEDAIHIARHDPVRVLADVAAKRQIIGLCNLDFNDDGEPSCLGGYGEAYWDVVRLLALSYAEHPDYREEWRP